MTAFPKKSLHRFFRAFRSDLYTSAYSSVHASTNPVVEGPLNMFPLSVEHVQTLPEMVHFTGEKAFEKRNEILSHRSAYASKDDASSQFVVHTIAALYA